MLYSSPKLLDGITVPTPVGWLWAKLSELPGLECYRLQVALGDDQRSTAHSDFAAMLIASPVVEMLLRHEVEKLALALRGVGWDKGVFWFDEEMPTHALLPS